MILLGPGGRAGATGPPSGSTLSTMATPQAGYTPGTPFSSGQHINVVVPVNSIFVPTNNLKIIECAAPGGVLPTDDTTCDGSTINGFNLKSNSDGSVDYHAETNHYYTLYALPNLPSLGESSGPAECDLTSECVLFIGDDQNDFSQPHYWSAPFYINPNLGVDSGVDPGDGSPPTTPAAPSSTESTVTPSAPTAAADGQDPITITVTLLGGSGVPVPDKAVALSQGTGHSVITPDASPETSDSNGVATFTVSDTTGEAVSYSAEDTDDSVVLAASAVVTFATPVVTPAHSTVVATPTAVPADGTTTATITVTLRDQASEAQPVVGKAVTLSGTSSSVIGVSTPAVTDAQGSVSFLVTDVTPESVTYSATDSTDGVALTSTAQVTFGVLSVSAPHSTLTAGTPAPVGAVGSQATVTLLTATGSPVAGRTVSLSAPSNTATVTPSSAVTGANGQAVFDVKDSQAESVTLSAMDVSDGNLVLDQTTVLVFQAPQASPTTSTVSPSTQTNVADGTSQAVFTVTVNDQFSNALSGKVVTLTAVPSGSVQFRPVALGGGAGTPGTTNAFGAAGFEADDTTAETVTFTAHDSTDGITLGTGSVTFTPGAPDGNQATVTSSPSSVPADGKTPSTISVAVNDHFGNHISNQTVSLLAENGSSVITPINTVTNANGVATFSATDDVDEVVNYSATDTSVSLELNAQAVVTFGNPPIPPAALADSTVVTSQQTVPADGSSSAIISVLLYDDKGDAVSGKDVSLTPSGGSSVVTVLTGATAVGGQERPAVSGTTGSNGQAQFSVTDTNAESVTYTATDTSDNMVLTGLDVTIAFSAAPASTTTTTPTTTSTTPPPAASSSGSTTTTTVSPVPPASSGGGDTSSGTSTSGGSDDASGASSAPTLAFTGSPSLLPWLLGLGGILLLLGVLGRRILARRPR